MARILVIDANEQSRRFMGAVLSSWGHPTEIAGDGEGGITAYRRHPFDLVFCDLNTPSQGDGETVARLLAEFPAARVIVMRDYTINDIAPTAMPPVRALDTIPKPLLMPELARVIQQHLERK
jgi:CheY-like chemotaxis protein